MTAVPEATGVFSSAMATPTTINDLFCILRDNPEWREQVRRLLLPQELPELPAVVAALAQKVREFIAEQREINREQKRTNDAIFAHLDRIEQDVSELKPDMIEVKTGLKEVKADVNQLKGTVSQFVGKDTKREVHANIGNLLSQYDSRLRRIAILKSIISNPDQDLDDRIADAVDDGIITGQENTSIRAVDLIACSRLRNSDATVYCAVEVSVTINNYNIRRAAERAAILSRAINAETLPAVVGGSIISTATELARETGVAVVTTRLLTV